MNNGKLRLVERSSDHNFQILLSVKSGRLDCPPDHPCSMIPIPYGLTVNIVRVVNNDSGLLDCSKKRAKFWVDVSTPNGSRYMSSRDLASPKIS
jgi:hypothetical protein